MAAKQLADFPRPPEDNGRGVHWSALIYHPSGSDLQHWMEELQALQIKWVKLLDDGGGSSIELCRAMIDHGIMPVVRLYRDRPNPDRIGGREIDAVRRLARNGVHYIETNNEPDLPAEWQGGHKPKDWLDIVVDNFIYDADIVLNEGGLPALPAMGPGSSRNPLKMVVDRGRKDLFENGSWSAIHNYTLNHPLDYPDDAVNQQGQALTQEEYDRYQRWQYSHLSKEEAEAEGIDAADYDKYQRWGWDGRAIEKINERRLRDMNSGDTIHDDHNCFRAWEIRGQLVYDALGFYVPIISTEGGPVVGWGDDLRYAKMNPTTHAEWQMEIFRFMQDEAPEWYFSCCTWLLASRPLGDFSPTWDQMSWYCSAWNEQFGLSGELPIIQMLKDTPAKVRHEIREPEGEPSRVVGTVSDRDGKPLGGIPISLRAGEEIIASGLSDAEGRYQLNAPEGSYDLYVAWVGPVARTITLTPGDVDTIDVKGMHPVGAFSIVGTLEDTAGSPRPDIRVELRRNGIVHAVDTTDGTGAFSFYPGVAGDYVVAVPGGSATALVEVDYPEEIVVITMPTTTELHYALTEKRLLSAEETGNRSLFYGWVVDEDGKGIKDVELEMRWRDAEPGQNFPSIRTGRDGTKPNADGYYEFLHSAGDFLVIVVQGDYESDIAEDLLTADVPGREDDPITYEINFQLRPAEPGLPNESVVMGSIPGGRMGQGLRLWSNEGVNIDTTLDTSRRFKINDLPSGVYDFELAGIGIIRSEIVLDGRNQVEINFSLLGGIIGPVVNAGQRRTVQLISESYGFTRRAQLSSEDHYRFTNLPPGIYRVELDDAIIGCLSSDGQSVLQAPLLQVGLMPPTGDSTLTGFVHDASNQALPGILVVLQYEQQQMAVAVSDVEGRVSFAGLGVGHYDLAVEGRVLAGDISLDGINSITVDMMYAPAMSLHKPLVHYYLLGTADPALGATLVRLIAPWLPTQAPGVAGFDSNEARRATTVTLLGDAEDESLVSNLESAECEVIDRRSDLLSLAWKLASPPSPAATPPD